MICEISSDFSEVQSGNSTVYKTHKPDILMRLLTTECNMAIENLAIFAAKRCAKLNENIPTKINDSYHLTDIFETLNAKGIPDNAFLVSFDISNMFPNLEIIEVLLLQKVL